MCKPARESVKATRLRGFCFKGDKLSQSRIAFEDYDGFVEKFKPKKTTDDCYTPPEIYDVVLSYVRDRWGVSNDDVVRPFWPGGD